MLLKDLLQILYLKDPHKIIYLKDPHQICYLIDYHQMYYFRDPYQISLLLSKLILATSRHGLVILNIPQVCHLTCQMIFTKTSSSLASCPPTGWSPTDLQFFCHLAASKLPWSGQGGSIADCLQTGSSNRFKCGVIYTSLAGLTANSAFTYSLKLLQQFLMILDFIW